MSAKKARKKTKLGNIGHIESSIRIAAESGDNYTIIFGGISGFTEKILKLKGYKVIETNHGTRIEW
jgi:hypothetical protein